MFSLDFSTFFLLQKMPSKGGKKEKYRKIMSQTKIPKRVLVTGSGTGIGREIALEFARQGADVALHYSHHDAGACSAVLEIQTMGRRAEGFQADFNDVAQAQSLGRQAIKFLGGVDCLVNIPAQFFLTQVVAEDMLKHGGGAICNVTSIHGVSGAPEHSVCAGTKGAITCRKCDSFCRGGAVVRRCAGLFGQVKSFGEKPSENREKTTASEI